MRSGFSAIHATLEMLLQPPGGRRDGFCTHGEDEPLIEREQRGDLRPPPLPPPPPPHPPHPPHIIRNINQYARTKTLAQGFLDMALFTANVSQLKHLLQQGAATDFFYFLFVLLCVSVSLQLIVAGLLIYKGSMNVENDDLERKLSDRMHLVNNLATGLILVITAVNVFITAFWFTPQAEGNPI